MELRSLTRAEAEIMKIIWQLKKAYVKDILANMPEPKPAYTTVATFLKILEKKQIVGHLTFGNSHEYYPIVGEEAYRRYEVKQLVENYFESSVTNLVSFFVMDKTLSEKDLNDLEEFIREKKKNSN